MKEVSIERIHDTDLYDKFKKWRQDYDIQLWDKWDSQRIVNWFIENIEEVE